MSTRKNKNFFRPLHLETLAFLIIYFVFSSFILVKSAIYSNIYISYAAPIVFGAASGFVFLYLFSHNDFFHFIGNLEKEERRTEKGYLGKFKKYGKFAACIIISAVGGPIFLALSVRFLFSKSENRYLILFFCTIASTIIVVAFARGLVSFL